MRPKYECFLYAYLRPSLTPFGKVDWISYNLASVLSWLYKAKEITLPFLSSTINAIDKPLLPASAIVVNQTMVPSYTYPATRSSKNTSLSSDSAVTHLLF